MEGRASSAVGNAFEGRLASAGGDVPEVDLGITARRCQGGAVGAPGDCPTDRHRDRPDKAACLRLKDPACGALAGDRDLGSVRTEGQVMCTGLPGPPPAGSTGRQVVDEQLPIVMDQGDPSAVGAESGRQAPRRAPGRPARPRAVDVPDRQGDAGQCVVAR